MSGLFFFVLISFTFTVISIVFEMKFKNAKFQLFYYLNFFFLFASFWVSTDQRSFFSESFYGFMALLFFVFLLLVPALHHQLTLSFQTSKKIISFKNYYLPLILLAINLFSMIFFKFIKNKTLFYYEYVENIMTISNFVGLMFVLPIITVFYTILNFKQTKLNTPFYKSVDFFHMLFLPLTIISWLFYKIIESPITSTILFINILLVLTLPYWMYLKYSVEFKKEFAQKTNEIDKFQIIFNKLENLMKTEKFYLNQNISVKIVAHKLKTNEKYLSNVINQKLGINFSSYINQLRIEEAKIILMQKNYENFTIEAIAELCGFKSKSVFNPLFRSQVGITPAAYRKSG